MSFVKSLLLKALGLATREDQVTLEKELAQSIAPLFPKPNDALRFCRTKNVKAPERGTSLSAGYDFFLPNDADALVLEPGQSALVPTGIHVSFPKEYVFIGFNKSGIAAKFKLLIGSQVIDADYQGEMHINLHNVGTETRTFAPGAKLTQFILLKVGLLPVEEEASTQELYGDEVTDRSTGGFGSTGV